MTATRPPAGQPAVRPRSSRADPANGVGGAVLLVGTRVLLWLGVPLVVAGLLILGGATAGSQPLHAVAAWWMVYAVLVDLATLGGIAWLLRRDGRSYRGLLGPPTAAWQAALGAVGVLAASVPAMVFSAELTSALFGEGTAPMFAVVEVPPLASIVTVVVAPLLAELAEPVAYLGVVLPRLEDRIGRAWAAATIVMVAWAAEHALYPLLVNDGGLDLGFAAYRVGSVLPFLAVWTALYYALGGGCCRLWRPDGSSTAARRWASPWAWPDEPVSIPLNRGNVERSKGDDMHMLVVNEFISLDRVVQAPGAADEDTTGGFAHGGWHLRYFDQLAQPLNTKPKYVASRTLPDPLQRQNSTRLEGNVAAAVAAPKQDGADLHLIGSTRLAQTLIQHGLVDEFRLMIDPLVLGGGKRLFPEDGALRPLRLVDSQATSTGAILATYAPADS